MFLFLAHDKGKDDFKRQCLVNRIDLGESMRMKKIQEWYCCHQISFKNKFVYRKDFSFIAKFMGFVPIY